jgi:hypothetical protein
MTEQEQPVQVKICACCGEEVNATNLECDPCPQCDRLRCESCTPGNNCICPFCESEVE